MFEKMTNTQLAEILNVDLISAEEMLKGTIEFEAEELVGIATFYGITLDDTVKYLKPDLK